MTETEKLDFCRVKKIFDRGFGFLSSLYYEEDIFFHFSKIKDLEAREKLENMKRGEVYVFYTSHADTEKRKVSNIWTNLNAVDKYLIPGFISKIIEELTEGKTNLFEVANVIKLLRKTNLVPKNDFEKMLRSPKTAKNPSIIKPMLTEKEHEELKELLESINEETFSSEEGIGELLNKLYGKRKEP